TRHVVPRYLVHVVSSSAVLWDRKQSLVDLRTNLWIMGAEGREHAQDMEELLAVARGRLMSAARFADHPRPAAVGAGRAADLHLAGRGRSKLDPADPAGAAYRAS